MIDKAWCPELRRKGRFGNRDAAKLQPIISNALFWEHAAHGRLYVSWATDLGLLHMRMFWNPLCMRYQARCSEVCKKDRNRHRFASKLKFGPKTIYFRTCCQWEKANIYGYRYRIVECGGVLERSWYGLSRVMFGTSQKRPQQTAICVQTYFEIKQIYFWGKVVLLMEELTHIRLPTSDCCMWWCFGKILVWSIRRDVRNCEKRAAVAWDMPPNLFQNQKNMFLRESCPAQERIDIYSATNVGLLHVMVFCKGLGMVCHKADPSSRTWSNMCNHKNH